MTRTSLVTVALTLVLAGCATFDPYASPPISSTLERPDNVGYCARLFSDADRRIEKLGVRDAEATRVAGFPYLRTDRFSAALVSQSKTAEQQRALLARLHKLDESARASELSNAALAIDDLERCRTLLSDADAAAQSQIRSVAKVPDDYSLAMRTFGIYPLTRVPFSAGIRQWQDDTRAVFRTPVDLLPVSGRPQRFAVAERQLGAARVARAKLDVLGVPMWSADEWQALLIRHAPVLEVDVAFTFDQPGMLALDGDDHVYVDATVPVVYTRTAYTLIGGLIHPQLVYTFWFSERPSESAFDLLAGKLDGVIWRVTLDQTGEALVYDSIHACGCYHLFFPTEKVTAREQPDTLNEGLFVPQSLRAPASDEAIVLRIESRTHYLQHVSVTTIATSADSVPYALRDERTLTTLQRRSGGTRSAYREDGLIDGSERAERFFFWPMGIKSAGQMRQWGRHATAFVGRRHFDDPLLFDAYFEIRP